MVLHESRKKHSGFFTGSDVKGSTRLHLWTRSDIIFAGQEDEKHTARMFGVTLKSFAASSGQSGRSRNHARWNGTGQKSPEVLLQLLALPMTMRLWKLFLLKGKDPEAVHKAIPHERDSTMVLSMLVPRGIHLIWAIRVWSIRVKFGQYSRFWEN